MLERFFLRPSTVDRIRASWTGDAIEQYVIWLNEHGYAARSVLQRVPLLLRFGEFARERGAESWDMLPAYVEPFVQEWLVAHGNHPRVDADRNHSARSVRGPIYQFLRVVLSGYRGGIRGSGLPRPFLQSVPQFFGTWSASAASPMRVSSNTTIIFDVLKPIWQASGSSPLANSYPPCSAVLSPSVARRWPSVRCSGYAACSRFSYNTCTAKG